MKTIEIEIPKCKVNALLECDAINLGGTVFIKQAVVAEAMAEYAKKKIEDVVIQRSELLVLAFYYKDGVDSNKENVSNEDIAKKYIHLNP